MRSEGVRQSPLTHCPKCDLELTPSAEPYSEKSVGFCPDLHGKEYIVKRLEQSEIVRGYYWNDFGEALSAL